MDDLITRAFRRRGPGHTYVPDYIGPSAAWGRPTGSGDNHGGVRSIQEAFPNRVCGVLRTENADAGFQACLAAMEGGVRTIEITKTVPSCFEMIRGLIATTGGRGNGTRQQDESRDATRSPHGCDATEHGSPHRRVGFLLPI